MSRGRLPRTATLHVKTKGYLFGAISHFHAPNNLPAERAIGERIARLTVAKALICKAMKEAKECGGKTYTVVSAYNDSIQNALLLADTANFEMYHQTIIDPRLLAPLKRPAQSVVKVLPFQPTGGNIDILSGLSPNYAEDIRKLQDGCGKVIEGGRLELQHIVNELSRFVITPTFFNIQLKYPHSLAKSFDAHQLSSFMNFPDTEDMRWKSKVLVESLKIYKKEAEILGTPEILDTLDQIHLSMKKQIEKVRTYAATN